eukprot:jgi/Chlat1/5196/Chrsp33S05173
MPSIVGSEKACLKERSLLLRGAFTANQQQPDTLRQGVPAGSRAEELPLPLAFKTQPSHAQNHASQRTRKRREGGEGGADELVGTWVRLLVGCASSTAGALAYFCSLMTPDPSVRDRPKWLHDHLAVMGAWVAASVTLLDVAVLALLAPAPSNAASRTEGRGSLKLRGWGLAYITVTMLAMLAWDTGNTLDSHGAYNLVVFVLGFVPSVVAVLLLLLLVLALPSFVITKRLVEGHRSWTHALGPSDLVLRPPPGHVGHGCQLANPVAWVDALDGSLSFDKVLGRDCGAGDEHRPAAEWVGDQVFIACRQGWLPAALELPRSENFPLEWKTDFRYDDGGWTDVYQRAVFNATSHLHVTLVEYDDFAALGMANVDVSERPIIGRAVASPHTEAVVASCHSDSSLHRLNAYRHEESLLVRRCVRNETAVERVRSHWKRADLLSETLDESESTCQQSTGHQMEDEGDMIRPPNVLLLYLDAVSRRHFIRKFPKIVEWLRRRPRLNAHPEGVQGEALQASVAAALKARSMDGWAFESLRYHARGQTTTPNDRAIFVGGDTLEEDFSATYQLNVSKVDHEFVPPFCDPSYYVPGNAQGNFVGPFSVRRRCLHGKEVHEWVLDYLRLFWEAYADVPKFVRVGFTEGHEGTGEIIGRLDPQIASFLQDFEASGHLNNTLVVIISDHGLHMRPLTVADAYQTKLENYLPLLHIVAPKYMLSASRATALLENTQALVGSFDIHATLLHVLRMSQLRSSICNNATLWPRRLEGKSLMAGLVEDRETGRTCRQAGINKSSCKCLNPYKLDGLSTLPE